MEIEHKILCKLDKESIADLPGLLQSLPVSDLFQIKEAVLLELMARNMKEVVK